MPATLRPTRLEVSDRFPMLGFNIRSDGTATRGEVALATDVALYRPENKGLRTSANFYCSRVAGNLVLGRGDTVYIVPPDVLARFVGQDKLYFGLATAGEGAALRVDVQPNADSPYVSLRGLSGRSMARVRILPTRQQRAAGYHGDGPAALDWAGDAATPGMAPAPGAANGSNGASAPAPAAAQPYDDGFGPMPSAPAPAATAPAATPAATPAETPAATPAATPGAAPSAAAAAYAAGMARVLDLDPADDRAADMPVYVGDNGEALSAGQARGLSRQPEYDGRSQQARAGAVVPAARPAAQRQPAHRAVRALGAGPSFEVKYRMFIPSPLIDAPTAVFGGDGRSFAYSDGTSRGEITARVRMTDGGGIAGIDLIDRHWGESTQYDSADSHAVPGKPSWWLDKNPGAEPTARRTLAASDDNLRIYAGAPGTTRSIQAVAERASLVTIDAVGSLPLSSIAPAIDVDVSLLVRITSDGIEVKVQGEHDGFPCHELYVNGQLVYLYDPVAAGSSPQALAPPMDVTATTSWIAIPLAAAQSLAEEALDLAPPPPPRARAMDGGVSAAIAIGGFVVESIRDSQGDVTWELDQFAHIKHPNDIAPVAPAPFKDAATIELNRWPVAGGMLDDISAWFSIDWQYNGHSIGNVRISNTGTNDAVGWGLHVRAQIMDDNVLYAPNQCAALRVRFHYRFTRSIGSDVMAVTDVHLYGDGTWDSSSRWLQASTLALEAEAPRIKGSDGNVSWDLMQFPDMKGAGGQAAATGRIDAAPVELADWPYIDEADGGRTQAALKVSWAYDAAGAVGAVRIEPGAVRSAGARTLEVSATVQPAADASGHATLVVTVQYVFRVPGEDKQVAVTRLTLHGDGKCTRQGHWQASQAAIAA